jgi:hypothetical protein
MFVAESEADLKTGKYQLPAYGKGIGKKVGDG